MPESILPPGRDKACLVSTMFGDSRNIELLADFLKAVLDIPDDEYQSIVIVNPNLPREYHDQKLGIVDLRLTTRSGQIIHVEIQRKPFYAMRERLVFYDASLIAGQIGESEKYRDLKRVITILITDNDLIPSRDKACLVSTMFGDSRNIELLADFLKAVLDIPGDEYQSIVIVNPNLPREYHDQKLGIVDLRLTTRSGQIIHVEIQRFPDPAMRDRLMFYDANLIAGQIGKGEKYNLKRVISILITDYDLIPKSPLYHHRFTLYDHRAAVEFTNLLEIRTLELTKIPETPDVYLWNWLRFLRAETMEELDMVANASPAIQKATAKVKKLSKDERARLLHVYEVMSRMSERAMREEGLEKGRTEERIAIVRNLLKRNRPISEIAEDTGLSHYEIKKLMH